MRITMGFPKKSKDASLSNLKKISCWDRSLQLENVNLESLVIMRSECYDESVPKLCTHRPSRVGIENSWKTKGNYKSETKKGFLGVVKPGFNGIFLTYSKSEQGRFS